jgi:hypothetical protein
MKKCRRTIVTLGVFLSVALLWAAYPASTQERQRIAVANEHAVTLEFFDLATGRLLTQIATMRRPHEMVVDRNTGRAYVSIAYKDGPFDAYEKPGNQIQVIDLDNMKIVDTIDITPHWAPHGLALDEKTGLLYASCESNGGELIGVNVEKKSVVFSAKIGVPHPHTVAIVSSLGKAYTANKDVRYISVIDLKQQKVIKEIPAPTGSEGIIATHDSKYVFVGNQTGTDLLVINPRDDEVIQKIPLDQPPSTFALSPDGKKLYITFWNMVPGKMEWHDGFIQELDIATLKPGAKLNVGRFPLNMTIAPDGRTAAVDTTADKAFVIVDLSQMKVIRRVTTDEWPHGLLIF